MSDNISQLLKLLQDGTVFDKLEYTNKGIKDSLLSARNTDDENEKQKAYTNLFNTLDESQKNYIRGCLLSIKDMKQEHLEWFKKIGIL